MRACLLGWLFAATCLLCSRSTRASEPTIELELGVAYHCRIRARYHGPEPPRPFRACGADPTEDGSACHAFAPCEDAVL